MKIKKSLQKRVYAFMSHAGTQKREVPEEAKIGRTITTFLFFTCALGAPMTDSLPYAVSAAGRLCTHGKDIPGLGPPNSLKLINLMKNKKSLKNRSIQRVPHTRPHKIGVPEEAKIGRSISRFVFFTCALGAPMTD